MQQFMISIHSIATNTSGIPEGMEDDHFDYLYNVGFKVRCEMSVRKCGVFNFAYGVLHTQPHMSQRVSRVRTI